MSPGSPSPDNHHAWRRDQARPLADPDRDTGPVVQPRAVRYVIGFNTAFDQQFLHVTVGQSVAQVPPHGHDDHLGREPEPSKRRSRRQPRARTMRVLHGSSLRRSCPPPTQQSQVTPREVVTDAAAVYPGVLDELIPQAWHHVEQYANNPIEADHGRLKHRLRPMRGLQTDRTAQVIIAGHAFIQNLRRGHYELGLDAMPKLRVATAFIELAQAI
jgi:hypothetical protein